MSEDEPQILDNCKWCGSELEAGKNVTRKKFCNSRCRDKHYYRQNNEPVTRGEWAKRRYGEVPDKDLDEIEKAWLAAMIDAEGSVGIYRSKRSGNSSGYRYHPVVSISNTDKDLIDHFRNLADCWVTSCKAKNREHNKTNFWIVTIKHRNLRRFIPKIKPYLIAKRQQSQVVENFLKDLAEAPMRTSTVHDEFEKYYYQTRKLNSNGPEPYSEYHDTGSD